MSPFRITAVVGLAALPTQAVETYVGVGPTCLSIFEDSAEYKYQAAAYANCASRPADLVQQCKWGVAAKVYANLIGPGAAHDDAFVDCIKWEPANIGHADVGSFCENALWRLLAAADQAAYGNALTDCGTRVLPAAIAKCKITTYNNFRSRLSLPNQAVVDRCLGTFSHVDFNHVDVAACYTDLGQPWATSENIQGGGAMQPVVEWYTTS